MSVFIIAEAGVNHDGDVSKALKLIDVALESGADAIKFQTFISDKLVSQSAQKADYQLKTTASSETQLEMIKRLELTYEDFMRLSEHCKQVGLEFLSTPFDIASLSFLTSQLNMKTVKISSGDLTYLPLLVRVGELAEKVILSTGMADISEIKDALSAIVFGKLYPGVAPKNLEEIRAAFVHEDAQSILEKLVCILHCTANIQRRLTK